jgi:hypothetical protein
MRNLLFAGVTALALFTYVPVRADDANQPDDHAPIGVMGDHLHKKGQWMAGYRYKHVRTSGYREGTDSVSLASVQKAYGEAAAEMDMGMHMLEVMYGVTDDLTLMLMPQYMRMEMTHQSSHGGGHSHKHIDKEFGDTEVTALYSLLRRESGGANHRAHLNIGVSLPTGSIDETFVDHHNKVYHLPYNMQFGSGTFDPILGATYTGEAPQWSWGAQTLNTIRLGKNDNGYRQGNRYTATAWAARNLAGAFSLSFRIEGEAWRNVEGRDRSLPINIIAGADPDQQSGERVLAHVGLNLLADDRQGIFSGHRLAAEFGIPLHERFSGPQPDTSYRLSLAYQFAF